VTATGALHLDALGDCFDGLFAAAPPARRLEILNDVHLGAFGVVAVVLLLLIKAAAIASSEDARALLLAPVAGRWMALLLARSRPARPEGLGGRLHAEQGRAGLAWALPVIASSLLFGGRGPAALAAGLLTTWGLGRLAHRRLGGQTGDVLGAGIELSEAAVLIAFAVRVQA
jgi:adenosylcobinamide-GDP ribazoletransferase